MTNFKTRIILMLTICISAAFAQTNISAFNYQGELVDNGAPANGTYDFIFTAFDAPLNGSQISVFAANNIQVDNGLFVIPNLDFSLTDIVNNEELWMSIQVKQSSDPVGSFETLNDNQKIQTVPYATQAFFADEASFAFQASWANEAISLNINGSSRDDMLIYNGNSWLPQNYPWKQQGAILSTADSAIPYQVSFGDSSPNSAVEFTVKSDDTGILSQFIGGEGLYNEFIEDGAAKGYIGSVQDGTFSGTTTDDFEIGTSGFNQNGKVHLTINAIPKLTVGNNGSIGIGNTEPTGRLQVGGNALFVSNGNKVGIGTPIPTAKFQINAVSSQGTALDVKIDNQPKLKVHSNGGTIVGKDTTPPVDGLYVHGDIKQNSASNGMLKYMVRVNCLNTGSSITRFHNAVNNSLVTASDMGSTGTCAVNFPTNINERYWQITAISSNGNHNANCHTVFTNNQLICQRTLSGAFNNGEMMILVY